MKLFLNRNRHIVILGILFLVLSFGYLKIFEPKAPSPLIKVEIFHNLYLSDDPEGYCFGTGGGSDSSQPCIFLSAKPIEFKTKADGVICFYVRYFPEENYYSDSIQLETNQRRILFPSSEWTVPICGTLEKSWGYGFWPDPMNPDDWNFKSDQELLTEISTQLKSKGYKLSF